MDTLPQDVYTNYSSLSRALPLVSKQLSQISLRGACNSMINKEELTEYMRNVREYNKLCFFVSYENFSRTDIFVADKFIGLLLQDEDWIHFEGSVHDAPFKINNIKRSEEEDLEFPYDFINYIKTEKDYLEIFTDINTAYKIFSKRRLCLQYPNYAKDMTKEYFSYIINSLNDNKSAIYLYLISNVMILNIDINLRDTFKIFENRYRENIEKYEIRVIGELESILDEVVNYIDNM
jgi:hypothetical protein